MKEFILVFIGGEPEKQEDLPRHYAEYGEFMKFLMGGGHFKSGIPADASDGRMVYKETVEKKGDFMSTANRVGGIMVILANNIDHAVDIAKQNPIIKNGGKVLVRPVKEM
jgi:hypothetical protein